MNANSSEHDHQPVKNIPTAEGGQADGRHANFQIDELDTS